MWEIWLVVFPVVSCPKCCLWTGSCSSCLNTSPRTTSPWYRPGSHPPYWCPSLLSDSGELPLYRVFTLWLFICFQIWIDTCWSVMSAVHWCTSWVLRLNLSQFFRFLCKLTDEGKNYKLTWWTRKWSLIQKKFKKKLFKTALLIFFKITVIHYCTKHMLAVTQF